MSLESCTWQWKCKGRRRDIWGREQGEEHVWINGGSAQVKNGEKGIGGEEHGEWMKGNDDKGR